MASDKAQDIDDNEAIMQLLPDLQRAAQILISYVLSPTYITSAKNYSICLHLDCLHKTQVYRW